MDSDEQDLLRRLKGARIVATKRNTSGRIVHLVEVASGDRFAMFHSDLMQLAAGNATLPQILARNDGTDLAGPWPPPLPIGEPGMRVEFRNGHEVRVPLAPDTTSPETGDTSIDLIASMISEYEALGKDSAPSEPQKRPPASRVRRFGRS